MAKFSPDCMPRPPDMITRALVNSGRSDLESSWLTNFEAGKWHPERPTVTRLRHCRPQPQPSSNAVPRTVITLIGSGDCTVAMALPA